MEHTENEIKLAHYVQTLYNEIEQLKGEIFIRDARITKMRGEIQTLKSLIGHQNIHIQELNKKNTIDINYEETN